MRSGILLAAMLTTAVLSACDVTAPGGSSAGLMYQSSPALRGVERDKAFAATLAEFKQRFQGVETDATAGTLLCAPDYLDRTAATATSQFRIISTKSDERRVVRGRVVTEGGAVRVEVLASLERRDTRTARQYLALRSGGDAPLETPIDVGAGRDPERREVWTAVGRDHAIELDLLTSIESRLTRTTQPAN